MSGLVSIGLVATVPRAPTTTCPIPSVPVPRLTASWMTRHDSFNERVKQGNVDLLLIGDSITQGWEGAGKDVWDKYYTQAQRGEPGHRRRSHAARAVAARQRQRRRHHAQAGRADDRHQQLERRDNTAEEIGDGIQAIVKKLREKLPQTKVLDPGRSSPAARSRIRSARRTPRPARSPRSWPTTRWSTISTSATSSSTPDGTLTKDIMPDYLHLSPAGLRDLGQVDRAEGRRADGRE